LGGGKKFYCSSLTAKEGEGKKVPPGGKKKNHGMFGRRERDRVVSAKSRARGGGGGAAEGIVAQAREKVGFCLPNHRCPWCLMNRTPGSFL